MGDVPPDIPPARSDSTAEMSPPTTASGRPRPQPQLQQQQQQQQQQSQSQQESQLPPQYHNYQQMPFHSQMDTISLGHASPAINSPQNPYGANIFDMSTLTTNLPNNMSHLPQDNMHIRSPYNPHMPSQSRANQPYHMLLPDSSSSFPYGRGRPQFDSRITPTPAHQSQSHIQQRQHFYGATAPFGNYPNDALSSPMSPASSDAFTAMYPAYEFSQYSPMEYAPAPGFSSTVPTLADQHIYALPPNEVPSTVPAYPRGPPRKPKQSGHALWVGNLPPSATVLDLKDHFSRDATKDIESLFLIAKSNCAFVNYRTEAACIAAMSRFHDSRFNGIRLVCRLRRGSNNDAKATPGTVTTPNHGQSFLGDGATSVDADSPANDASSPVIVGHPSDFVSASVEEQGVESLQVNQKVAERFFIVKSLTVQDLEASVRNGTWATQSHNEDALNRAYQSADIVYLIFSANKSGQYFGYARMASPISGQPMNLDITINNDEAKVAGNPHSTVTPATETAPRGRIIDDSARGTIFWEAEPSDEEDNIDAQTKDESEAMAESQRWGRQFNIEWLSTSRLPFFRTRGLRNPWNANREVKIARDGTELEPSVGRRLLQMFHRIPQPAGLSGGTIPSIPSIAPSIQ